MNWFNNLKVGTKLITGFLMVAAIAALVGTTGIVKIHQMDDADTRLYEKTTVPLGDLAAMSVSFQRVRINLRDALESSDPKEKQAAVDNIANLRQEVGKRSASFEKTIVSPEVAKVFAEFKESRNAYGGYIEQALQLDKAGKTAEAQALVHGAAKKAALHEQELLNKLMELEERQGKMTADANSKEADMAVTVTTVLVVLGALLAVALGFFIARQVTRPLKHAVAAADALAEGDLSVKVEVTTHDETGQMLSAMNNMVENLRELISRTVDISTGIASASEQLQATATQIATGAEEVASQTGTVATASEEMAATSSEIACNCGMAASASQLSMEAAQNGTSVVQQTITGMVVIADQVRQTSLTVQALGERSEQIGDIVGTIQDIADQTNLLALNAAIEAARAGEQGRGFAVVADEVRALAERTTVATREIGEMIKSIQSETKAAVKSMEEGVKEVERGALSSEQSGKALEEIQERIGEVAMQVSQIATAAEQQTATTGEVTNNIQQITSVVADTARGADETASAAAQLASRAQELRGLVSQFRLA